MFGWENAACWETRTQQGSSYVVHEERTAFRNGPRHGIPQFMFVSKHFTFLNKTVADKKRNGSAKFKKSLNCGDNQSASGEDTIRGTDRWDKFHNYYKIFKLENTKFLIS